ncbi:GTP cyclohydrolase II [Rhizobacter sp. Root1221]|uniref:GTP cyclohydrolase II n=1 Tax=Rhizobacter sp. Root1221 TaxID=1736433 RepID=UPI0006F5692F|nr:GTP cyclohydrolase II [Rhizobacter sp. Root1221]KQV78233.1 GTP cyclohydrolase [Rhizobacter sp. Root1221]
MSTLPSLVSCWLPTELGEFQLHGVADPLTGREHAALTMGDLTNGEPVLTRVHSECLTGDTLFSLKCDCGPQLQGAIEAIAKEGRGALVYLRQEGRGIGLVNKIRAYALQQAGADTVDANRLLGLPDDSRDYKMAHDILAALGVSSVRLMTNNPGKVEALRKLGILVTERVELNVGRNPHNHGYLDTKARRMGHLISTPLNLHDLVNKEQS